MTYLLQSGLGPRLDLAGAGLAAVSVAWTLVTGRHDLGAAWPVAGLQAGCAVVYISARLATRWQPPLVPVAAMALVATLLVLGSVVPDLTPLGPPLGYANANAALYVQLAVAAAMAAAVFPLGPATAVAAPMGAAFVLAAVVSGSVTAMVAIVVVVALAGLVAARKPVLAVGAGGLAVLLLVGATALVAVAAATGRQPSLVARAGDAVDDRRVALWADAAAIARDHPLAGAGAGRFQDLSPAARSDDDARWAHSDFLQQGAEGGAVAMGLLLAAFGWGVARVAAAGAGRVSSALGGLALAALGLHAAIDYILHFPLVPLVAAALVGAATATPRPGPPVPPPGWGSPGSPRPAR